MVIQDLTSTLRDPVAQELLTSTLPAQLAYLWPDGTPRVVPIWFHWDGSEIVMGTPPTAPKVAALRKNPEVTVSINGVTWPYKILQLRGTARLTTIEGLADEYILAAKRYLGEAEGQSWVAQAEQLVPTMIRIAITPDWAHILDFETRFPSALVRAMKS